MAHESYPGCMLDSTPPRSSHRLVMNGSRSLAAILGSLLLGHSAHADLPPPVGMTRVLYQFRVDSVPAGMILVAFHAYNPANRKGNFVPLAAGKSVNSYQGYTPGIYALPQADAALLIDQDDKETEALLKTRAQLCLKAIPRVFTVSTRNNIAEMEDVLHVTVTPQGCSTHLVSTTYASPGGARGEGGVDAAGHRRPPPPFGQDLPDVLPSGLNLLGAPPSTGAPAGDATGSANSAPAGAPASVPARAPQSEPARGGCAGCAVLSVRPGANRGTWLAVALAVAVAWQRRRAR